MMDGLQAHEEADWKLSKVKLTSSSVSPDQVLELQLPLILWIDGTKAGSTNVWNNVFHM